MRIRELGMAAALSCVLLAGMNTQAYAASETVNTFSELQSALQNATITEITIASEISITSQLEINHSVRIISDEEATVLDTANSSAGFYITAPTNASVSFSGTHFGQSSGTSQTQTYINATSGTTTIDNGNLDGATNAAVRVSGASTIFSSDHTYYASNVTNTSSNAGAMNIGTGSKVDSSSDNFCYNQGTMGGAIYNAGELTIESDVFTDNAATGAGGAIYNTGTLNITGTSFSGNKAANESNAIENIGTVNFYGNTLSRIEDKITGVGTMNISNTSVSSELANIAIYNDVEGQTVNFNGGTLAFHRGISGNGVTSQGNFTSTVKFNIQNTGTIDLRDSEILHTTLGNIVLNSDAYFEIDADLGGTTAYADTISAASASGSGHLILNNVNIINDTTEQTVSALIAEGDIKDYVMLATNPTVASPENYNYLLSYDSSSGYLTFNNTSVVNLVSSVRDTSSQRVYDMAADELVSETPGTMGGGSGASLTVNANNHNITADGSGIGAIGVSSGQTLNINDAANYSGFTTAIQNSGTTTIKNSTFSGNTTSISNSGTLNLSGVTIQDAMTQTNAGRTNLSGTNTISGTISGTGTITNSGTLTTSGNNSAYTGAYNQTAGTTNANGTFFGGTSNISGGTLNWNSTSAIPSAAKLVVSNGNLNVNQDLTIGAGSSVAEAVTTNIASGKTLSVSGGTVGLNTGDTWDGNVNLSSGTLNINNISGAITATGGALNLNGGTLSVASGSSIANNVTTEIASGTTLDITGGNVGLNQGDNWAGSVNLSSGTLDVNNISGAITADSGKLNITGGTFSVDANSSIAQDTAVAINTGTTLNTAGGEVNLGSNDIWNGTVNVSSGNLNLNNLVSNGTITANGGVIEIEAGKLTIAGQSDIYNASNVKIDGNGSLVYEKNATVNNITGTGDLTIDGITLTIDNNSHLDKTIGFTSKNNSTVLISGVQNADDAVSVVNNGTNSNLTINMNNSNTSANLNIDSTGITNLTTSNNVNYNGNIINNGTITNTGNLTVVGAITGSGTIYNSNSILVNADQSGFTGQYTQTAGTTVITASGEIFGGDKNINGGSVDITSNFVIDYKNVHLGNNAVLNHTTSTADKNTVSSSVVNFTGSGASVIFDADTNITGNYELSEKIDNGNSNSVIFKDSTVTLGSTDYTGQTTYKFENAAIDLENSGTSEAVNDYTFSNLSTNNTSLNFRVEIADDNIGSGQAHLNTDTLTVLNGSDNTKLNFGSIYITGNETGQAVYNTQKDVLSGAQFNGSPDQDNVTYDVYQLATGATTAFTYIVNSANNNHSISLNLTGITDEHSLYVMNDTEGTRFFQFADDGTNTYQEYHIDESLSATLGPKAGQTSTPVFTVSGHNRDNNVISGAIYDKTTHQATGDNGSFFNIASGTDIKLDIKDLTIQEAYKNGNGSVVENNSEKAVITIDNVGIKDNSATGNGGAIYNVVMPEDTDTANLIITNSVLTNNTADGNGGAIYNAGNMAITNSTFTDNDAGKGGAIYNAGSMILNNVTVVTGTDTAKNDIFQEGGSTVLTSTNTIGSNISGDGSIINQGIFNSSGDNSNYTGSYTQETGTTTVTGTFFGGESIVEGGTLNWFTENDIPSTGTLEVKTGNLIIGADQNQKAVLTIGENSSIADAVATMVRKNSTLNVAGGTANIGNNDTWNGTINITDGTLNIENVKSNGILEAVDGKVNINSGSLNIADGSSIAKDIETYVKKDVTVNITDKGYVSIDDNDTWEGLISVNGGTLDLTDPNQQGGILDANTGKVNINSGKVEIGEGSKIAEAVETYVKKDATVDITDNGYVSIDRNDTWEGLIALNGGTLDLTAPNQQGGTLDANTGKVNINSDSVEIADGSNIAKEVETYVKKDATVDIADKSYVSIDDNDIWEGLITVNGGELDLTNPNQQGGTLDANTGKVNINSGSVQITNGSSIAKDVETYVKADTTVNITDKGYVSIDDNDTWEGVIAVNGGEFDLTDPNQQGGTLDANTGKVNINSGKVEIGEGSKIAEAVETYVKKDATVDITDNGYVSIDRNDTWEGLIALNGGTLDYDRDNSGKLDANTGNLNLQSGSHIEINEDTQIEKEVNINIKDGANVDIVEKGILDLDKNDNWSGNINVVEGGILTTDNLVNNGGTLNQTGGSTTIGNKSDITFNNDSSVTGGDLSIVENSILTINSGVTLNPDNMTLSGGSTLGLLNGELGTVIVKDTLTVNDTNNISIDISPRDWKHDTIIIDNLVSDTSGTINISDFDFLGLPPIDRHIKLKVLDASNISRDISFTTTDKEIFTPIGWYDLKSIGGGYFSSNLTRYNPQVFRGQAATLASYNNQLAIDDIILNHVSLHSERFLNDGQYANKHAIADSMFAPYQYTKKDGGLWFKSYINFESLSMTQNLKVRNNAYGSIIGADFPLVEMKNGWKFLPTAFISYNGGHQSFNNVSMYQNGGQGGFMGTFMKDDFIGSVMAYGGGYFNEMSVAGNTDKAGNWFAGTAAKLAYNLHATEHFTVQPTAFVSYNIFGRQNWGTDFGVMSMNSGYLNGISVAPGVNLIYARETWSMYATIQYMYNINEQVSGRAGNVDLPNLEMRHGYLQYGIGATKTWKDRLNSYFQITFRNGGRTGVGFQLGLQYLFDFKNSDNTVKIHHKKTTMTDNNKTIKKNKTKSVIKSL